MRKIIILPLIIALLAALTACGTRSSDTTYPDDEQIKINDVPLYIGMNITADIIQSLGNPSNVLSAPSCHYDGDDTLYAYDGWTLYTYVEKEQNILYLIELTDQNVPLTSGACVGMTLEQIKSIYGTGFTELGSGVRYILSDDLYIAFFLKDNVVTSLELGQWDGDE